METKRKKIIKLNAIAKNIGKGYEVSYTNKDKIYKHRLNKSDVYVGKGFIIIIHKTIKLTTSGITGG